VKNQFQDSGLRFKAGMAVIFSLVVLQSAFAFEGRINVALTRGGEISGALYTVGTNDLRIEQTDTDRPHARDIVNLETGDLTLLFPQNRGFVRLKNYAEGGADSFPPGVGPQSAPGANTTPTMPPPGMGMPAMPAPPMEKLELTATGGTTNILGFDCTGYEIKSRGEVMEIWATDGLFAFQPYLENQPRRFGPRRIEEQWGGLLKAKKIFPLVATLKFENGAERYRFEVKSVAPGKVRDESLFQPPPEYQEIRPLPF